MRVAKKKVKAPKVEIKSEHSKYAGKPLHSPKEKAAKNFAGVAADILEQFGLVK